jgi:hypothetical protein
MAFPQTVLGIKAELDVNGTWTDITDYVYQRAAISISDIGRPDESGSVQAGEMTLTLNNRDGRFTPDNADGAWYPYVQLNTQMRLSVDSSSADGTSYSGYRFWGEVSEWPVLWDPTGSDIYVQVTVSGIWRRLSQDQTSIGSAMTRYVSSLTSIPMVAYWSMEDGTGSVSFAGSPVGTASPLTWPASPAPAPSLAANSDFKGSDAIMELNGSELTATITTPDTTTQTECWFALSVPAGGDSGAQGANRDIVMIQDGGTIAYTVISLDGSTGQLYANMYNSSRDVIIATQVLDTAVTGVPVLVRFYLNHSGSSADWEIQLIRPGDTSAWQTISGSYAGTVSGLTDFTFAPSAAPATAGNALTDVAAGQLAVFYASAASDYVTAASALGGHAGETAVARFGRLCTEQGIGYETIGSGSIAMGPQLDDTFANVLQTIENTDGGLLYETQDQLGLGYRTRTSMQDQSAALTLDYSAAQIAQSLAPVFDDQLIRNNITFTNADGYSLNAYLATGTRSVLASPDGAGPYPYSRSTNANADADLDDVIEQALFSGVVTDNRYPTVPVDLSRSAAASLFSLVPSLRVGDYFEITNMPSFMGGGTSRQLQWGRSETLNNFTWTITWNAIPESPWESDFSPGTTVSGQAIGTPVTGGQSGTISGAQLAVGSVGTGALSTAVSARSLGGISTVISSAAPADPVTGDIWFNASNGYQMEQWDGTEWVPVTWDGTSVLAGGSISVTLLDGSVTATALGGITTTISQTQPSDPNAGDIWINASNGYQLTQFDGTQWNPITWDADSVISAGTIDASLITAGTIDASLLAAGLVIAGAVDGTVINAAQINGGTITAASITAVSIGAASIIAATMSGGTISNSSFVIDSQNGGDILVYEQTDTVTTYTSGSGSWTAPAGTLYARVQAWGGGGGGDANSTLGSQGGGGGEYAEEPQLAVTPGDSYSYSVGAAGTGGTPTEDGTNGGNTAFTGDSVTVAAYGGAYGLLVNNSGAGGDSSSNSIHFPGGSGGSGDPSSPASPTTETVTFSTPGTYSWTVPSGADSATARFWGAGAGGAGGAESSAGGGEGGGGGAYGQVGAGGSIGGEVWSVTVGAGGAAGSPGNLGGNGGTSSVTIGGTAYSAGGGTAATLSSVGHGGAPSSGITGYSGGNGGSATSTGGSGGGTSAGTAAAGTSGTDSSSSTPGAGTAPPSGGGSGAGGGWGTGSPTTGGNAGAPGGGGGGGGGSTSAAGKAGGAGGAGQVTITYTIPGTDDGGGGGGGSSAGPSGSGADGGSTTTAAGGPGGTAPSGGGNGGHGGTYSTTAATAGSAPGGGGGGGYYGESAGAAGANGKLIIAAVERKLVLAIAAASGTDAYGNGYDAGLNFFGTTSGSANVTGDATGAMTVTGNVSVSGTVTSTGGTASSPTLITTDTWHSLGSFTSSPGSSLTIQEARYQLTNDGRCEIDLAFTLTGTITAGSYVFANALSSEYQFPGNYARSYPLGYNNSATQCEVRVFGASTATPGRVECDFESTFGSGVNITNTIRIPVS